MRRILACASLMSLVVGGSAFAQDADGDGVPDVNDNCINHVNPTQLDTNYDGFGNHCDPDYYNDGTVDNVDYQLFVECFGGAGNPHCDLTGDGITGIPDFVVFQTFNGGPPGPSGLACAGTLPCSDPTIVGDADADGVGDDIDNCVNQPNPSQLDTNADGLGNHCDPDYDNDGTVDAVDYEIFLTCFGGGGNPDCDLTGDGVTGIPDFVVFQTFNGGPPGPAGPGAQDSCPCDIQTGNCP